MKKKLCIRILMCLSIILLLCVPISAEGENAVWGTIQDQTAVLYLLNANEMDEVVCQIGNTLTETSEIRKITDLETPIHTIIVLDNSLSIREDQRELVHEILENVIGNRMPGELFTIATVSDTVNYLCESQTDYFQLKLLLDGLEYQNQATQLTDGLYQVLQKQIDAQDGILRRIIVVSDGVDNKEIGYTREELQTKMKQAGYPFYVIGCSNSEPGGKEALENFFALSRLTSGAVFYLEEAQDPMQIAAGIAAWNHGVCISIPLPDEMCDGSVRHFLVTAGSAQYTLSLTMPFAKVSVSDDTVARTPDPISNPTLVPTDQEESISAQGAAEAGAVPWIVGTIGLLSVIAFLGIVVAIRIKSKKKNRDNRPCLKDDPYERDDQEKTEMISAIETDDEKTSMIWAVSASNVRRLVLTDLNDHVRHFEVPLQSAVMIGRDPSACTVTIDYDPTVARRQCEIFLQNNNVMICNKSNSNITQLNGQKVFDSCVLNSGSTIKMGRTQLRVEIL